MARPSEDELIARFFAPLAGPGGLGLRDDAALFSPPPGQELVLTVDAVVAGVHFLPDDPPETVGAKALGVNLSDLAAKGADPLGFLLALALPDHWTEGWLGAFSAGLAELAGAAGCPLLGGDTVRSAGPLLASITAIGCVPAGRMVRRTTARAGDVIAVTGTIGDAVLGLRLLNDGNAGWAAPLAPDERDELIDRYRRPRPRTAFAPALRDGASAAMDVSDGLAGDLAKMLRASGVTGSVDLGRLPLSRPARAAVEADPALLAGLASGGDDYEILFTAAPERLSSIHARAAEIGLPVTVIGQVSEGTGPPLFRDAATRRPVALGSFQHF